MPEAIHSTLASTEGPTFMVRSVHIEGATSFAPEVLQRQVAHIQERTITLAEAQVAAEAITLLYRNAGFILARAFIPAQELRDDVLAIRVAEGEIGEVRAEPAEVASEIMASTAREIAKAKPFQVRSLERALLRLNDYPGLNVRALIEPSVSGVGRSDIVLLPTRDRAEGAAIVENSGPTATGPWRGFLVGTLNGWASGGESTTLVAGGSLLDWGELWTLGLQHEQHLRPGTLISFGYSQARSAPGADLAALDLRTRTETLALGGEQSFFYGRGKSLTLGFGLERVGSEVALLGERISLDRLWLVDASVAFDFFDSGGGGNRIVLEAEQELGGRRAEDISRMGASVTGFNFTATVARQQQLGTRTSLYLGIQGRWSAERQIASQEVDFGGTAFGRGFAAAAITGEEGLGGTIEVRRTIGCARLPGAPACEPFVFVDSATVLDRSPDGSVRASIGSIGGGVRLQFEHIGIEAGLAEGVLPTVSGVQPRQVFLRLSGDL
jgi:hemolysin activation/secretion protein